LPSTSDTRAATAIMPANLGLSALRYWGEPLPDQSVRLDIVAKHTYNAEQAMRSLARPALARPALRKGNPALRRVGKATDLSEVAAGCYRALLS
jgi:hypothetical protein